MSTKPVFITCMLLLLIVTVNSAFCQVDQGDIKVSYTVRTVWDTGATIDIVITNNSMGNIVGWNLNWTFPGNQRIYEIWNASFTQTGAVVTAANLAYNATIPALGGQVSFGFNCSFTGTNDKPLTCSLNGIPVVIEGNTTDPSPDIFITYTIRTDWGTGATVDVVLKNNGTADVNGWVMTWTFPGNQKIYEIWKARYTQTGQSVSVTPLDYNMRIPANGGEVTFGFNLGYTGSNTKPVDLAIKSFRDEVDAGSGSAKIGNLNTTSRNVQQADPLAGIRHLSAPVANIFGTATVQYPVPVPDGVNGLTPQVAIFYSNEGGIGNCGLGWNLGMSAIARDLKKGVPRYDSTDKLLLDGKELVNVGGNVYRFKQESSFDKVVRNPLTGGFFVYKLDGSIFFYGNTANSRFVDPANPSNVYAWYLDEIRDKLNNKIVYQYDPRGPYDDMYTTFITYGYGFTHSYRIEFVWENIGHEVINGRRGFLVKDNKRLRQIRILYRNQNGSVTPLKIYELSYDTGNFQKLLLSKITEKSGDGLADINRTDFQYNRNDDFRFDQRVSIPVADLTTASHEDLRYTFQNDDGKRVHTEVDFVDFNGDGIPDRVAKHRADSTFYVQYGTGQEPNEFTGTFPVTSTPMNLGSEEDLRYTFKDGDLSHTEIDFVDIDGDRRPDKVWKHRGAIVLYVQYNTSTGFSDKVPIMAYSMNSGSHEDLRYTFTNDDGKRAHTEVDFLDFNGDGLPDRVAKQRGEAYYLVQYNTGSGFTDTVTVNCPPLNTHGEEDLRFTFTDGDKTHAEIDLVDFNGDGLPDRVAKNRVDDFILVQYNIGGRFTDTSTIHVNPMTTYGQEDLRYTFRDNDGKQSHTEIDFLDFNGDGLPDRVAKHRSDTNFYVQFNTGDGFTDTVTIASSSMGTVSHEDLRYAISDSDLSHTEVDLIDVNGDGLPDKVQKHRDSNSMYVQYNLIGKQNGLMSIYNSVGEKILLQYKRVYCDPDRNTTHDYSRRWVLGYIHSGNEDTLLLTTKIDYEKGIYDMKENEFRGFAKVVISADDKDKPGVTNITENHYYVNDKIGDGYDPYLKGQLKTVNQILSLNGVVYPLNRLSYEYSKVDILSTNITVKFVYLGRTRAWVYDSNLAAANRFMGADATNGDPLETNVYSFDTSKGLMTQMTNTKHYDPFTANDDVTTTAVLRTDMLEWSSCISSLESKDNAGQRLSLKTFGYNTNATISNETQWSDDGNDLKKSFEYDMYGNVTKITSADNTAIGSYVLYRGTNNVYIDIISTQADGIKKRISSDPYGRVYEEVMNPDTSYSQTTRYSYDIFGRLYQVDETINNSLYTTKTINYTYKLLDSRAGVEYYFAEVRTLNNIANTDFLTVQYFCDSLGRILEIKTEGVVDGVKSWIVSGKTEYDRMGRVLRTGSSWSVPYVDDRAFITPQMVSPVTTYAYDSLSRNNKITMGNGTTSESTTETLIDNSTGTKRILFKTTHEVKDAAGIVINKRASYKDMMGQVVKTETRKSDASLITSTFTYTLTGYSLEKMGTSGYIAKQYDSLGRLKWVRTLDRGKIVYTYNGKGMLSKIEELGKNEIDAVSRVINYAYDDVTGKIIMEDFDGTADDVHYEYYPAAEANLYSRSQLKKITKGGFSVQYTYGNLWNEETKTIDGSSYTTRYEYDEEARIRKVTYPDGEVVSYSYNEGSMLAGVSGNETYITEIKYNKNGQRTFIKYGNGTTMMYAYNADGTLDKYIVKDKNGLEILRHTYAFDALGAVSSVTDNPAGVFKSKQTYAIDTFLSRLDGSTGQYAGNGSPASNNNAFVYDDNNRITKKTEDGTTYDYVYIPGMNSLSRITVNKNGSAGSILYQYDDFGNVVRKEYAGLDTEMTQTYTYDVAGNMKTVKGSNVDLELSYDHEGQRLSKVSRIGGTVAGRTLYVNGLYSIVQGKASKNICDGKNVIASKTNDKTFYYHSNHIGSTALMTDKNGMKVQSYLYYPFGRVWIQEVKTATTSFSRLFTGQELDGESGLYYYNARYFDPATGTFMSPDPMTEGFNPYAYAHNNPVMYSDPTGMWSIGVIIVFSYDKQNGFGVGVGIAVDFRDIYNIGFAANISYIKYDESSSFSFGGVYSGEKGIIGFSVGSCYTYNTKFGHSLSVYGEASIFSVVGIQIATNHYWDKDGDYQGGSLSFMPFLGNTQAHFGGGYQFGWGKCSSGWYTEQKLMGFTWRNYKFQGYSGYIGGTLDMNSSPEADPPIQILGRTFYIDISVLTDIGNVTGIYYTIESLGKFLAMDKSKVGYSISRTGIDVWGVDNMREGVNAETWGILRTYKTGHTPKSGCTLCANRQTLGVHEYFHTTQFQNYGILMTIFYGTAYGDYWIEAYAHAYGWE